MSKAKWFAVKKPSTGEIIATSANQIVPPKFRGPKKMLYYIHQTHLSSCSAEGGSGDETSRNFESLWLPVFSGKTIGISNHIKTKETEP